MNYEMDYEEDDYIIPRDNKLTISNIDQLNSYPSENENLRGIKFFRLNNYIDSIKDIGSDKNKQKIINYLLNSKERLESLIGFFQLITIDNSLLRLKNIDEDIIRRYEKSDKNNNIKKINLMKKIDIINKTQNSFNKKLSIIKENNKISQSIFKELNYLKDMGFIVDESFMFPNPIGENIKIKLTHKYFRIYQNIKIFKKDKFDIYLLYDTKLNKFELISDYYKKFIKEFKIVYNIDLKLNNNTINTNIDQIIKELIIDNLKTNPNLYYLITNPIEDKYQIKNILIFYYQYILYYLFKLEIKSLIDIFIYKNLSFILKESGSITICSYNYFEFKLSIKKVDISHTTIYNIFPYDNLFRIMFENIIYDIKIYKNIKDAPFTKEYLSILDSLDCSIYIKNLTRISQLIIRKSFISYINTLIGIGYIDQIFINTNLNIYTYRYTIIKNNNLNNNYNKIEFSLIFNKTNLYFTHKNPTKNNIYMLERETITEYAYQRIDYNYLIYYISNLLNR